MTTSSKLSFTLPHDPLTALSAHEEPTPFAVRHLRREVFANALAVESSLGGGDHGHLGMVMPQVDYTTVSTGGAAYVFPVKPAVPNYAGVAAAARDGLKDEYKEAMDEYNEARALQKHLKAQMIQAIPKIYISELEDAAIGYANVTPAAMLAHLMTEFGVITPKDLAANLENIKRPWDPKQPIQEVFTNGTNCRQFAIEGREPISDTAYVRDLITVFRKTGVLDKAVQDFEEKPPVDQTVDACIAFFKSRDRLRRNNAQATKEALEANQATKVDTAKPKFDSTLAGWAYCWSHGICSSHNGKTCSQPLEGHKKEATLANRMGGKTWIEGYRPPFRGNRNRNRNSENEGANANRTRTGDN
jgi:hypothetical protein